MHLEADLARRRLGAGEYSPPLRSSRTAASQTSSFSVIGRMPCTFCAANRSQQCGVSVSMLSIRMAIAAVG